MALPLSRFVFAAFVSSDILFSERFAASKARLDGRRPFPKAARAAVIKSLLVSQ